MAGSLPPPDPETTPSDSSSTHQEPTGTPSEFVQTRFSITVPGVTGDIIHRAAQHMGLSPKLALEQLLRRVTDVLVHGTVDFGFEFRQPKPVVVTAAPTAKARAAAPAQPVRPVSEDKPRTGRPNTRSYPAPAATPEMEAALQKNPGRSSGYVGVYVNGANWVARGPEAIYIGSYPSAKEAALARLAYYNDNGIPYGDLAAKVTQMIEQEDLKAFGVTDPEVYKRVAIYEAKQAGKPFAGLTAEERQWETSDPFLKLMPRGTPGRVRTDDA